MSSIIENHRYCVLFMSVHTRTIEANFVAQVNEALSDKPSGQLDHSMRVELDHVLHNGQRITLCMARCVAVHQVVAPCACSPCTMMKLQSSQLSVILKLKSIAVRYKLFNQFKKMDEGYIYEGFLLKARYPRAWVWLVADPTSHALHTE